LIKGQQLAGNLPAAHHPQNFLFLEDADAKTAGIAERKTEVRAAAFARALDAVPRT